MTEYKLHVNYSMKDPILRNLMQNYRVCVGALVTRIESLGRNTSIMFEDYDNGHGQHPVYLRCPAINLIHPWTWRLQTIRPVPNWRFLYGRRHELVARGRRLLSRWFEVA